MQSFFLSASLALFSTRVLAQYYLVDDYVSDGQFFNRFNFDTSDPTHGFVQYQTRNDAQSSGLISASGSNVFIGVDDSNVTPNGRPSVRITSNKTYDSGLFILDLQHMPGGICGTWPATVGPNWPSNGEIDIIEGVHQQTVNDMSFHTSDNCTLANTGAFSGNEVSSNCYINAPGQSSNQGCTTQGRNTNTYGSGFNNIGGGVYATEWVSDAISIWFFPRGQIPQDIQNGQPSPGSWGAPLTQLYGPQGCDIPSHFNAHSIVFDTTFCGDWAGAVWGSTSCAAAASSCNDFVANNPQAFDQAYWSINSLKIYHINGQANFKAFTAPTPENGTSAQPDSVSELDFVPENSLVPVSPMGNSSVPDQQRLMREARRKRAQSIKL
ncbi:concanavalin A-like lectin glucanase domain-containing [Lecanosticta acicola]|uniref:endo-1,3(4)-beta-glucanase n=1 Tax=Lecanosticta acicola TaxID=111012 RepID=A0AAI8YYS7_9PEZI|nr:concanavalin A-like lectin glucanase domain-containing [Lecanosticta acicola]